MSRWQGFRQAILKWKVTLSVVVLLVGVSVGIWVFWGKKSPGENYILATVKRGDIKISVSATGTLQAIVTVQVGSQVSGTIAFLGADFNSRVKKGQVVATLDPAIFQAQVDNAQAALLGAQASDQTARSSYNQELANLAATRANIEVLIALQKDAHDLVNRNRQLPDIISAREIEASVSNAAATDARLKQSKAQTEQAQASVASAKARIDQAAAQVQAAKAMLDQQKITLSKTVITSPVDGVVVSRNVDVGQTVAASLAAPTLFTIANDLTKMQVLASIDEADVGLIKEGQTANFGVDAFPDQVFTGTISQLRLISIVTQNVITYNAVINFDNPDGKLRPGMTANVTVSVEERLGVLKVPNAAFRFKPAIEEGKSVAPADAPKQAAPGAQTGKGSRSSNRPTSHMQTLWVLTADGKLESRKVESGLTDGKDTEITGGEVKEGDRIAIGLVEAGSSRSQQPAGGSPFGGRPTGGLPRR